MYAFPTRVTLSCTGPDGLQTPLSTVTMMQDCSMLWMESEPELERFLEERGAAMMVASRQVDFLRRPAYGERLEVRTWIYRFRGKLGYRNTAVLDESGAYVAKCWGLGVFVTRAGGKMIAPPQDVLAGIALDDKLDMDYRRRKIALPDTAPKRMPPVRARRSDLDFNGHVNNVQYLRMAYDLLPGGFEPTRLRVMHEGQAHEGDLLHPLLYEDGARLVCVLEGDDSRPFATVEWE